MFCSVQTNNMINQLHERALTIVLIDCISDVETMLRNINDITSHFANIQTLAIELFKIMYKLGLATIDSTLNRRPIGHNLTNLKRVSDGKKENCVIWS